MALLQNDISNLGSPRMVVDNRLSEMSDTDAESVIHEQMEYLTHVGSFDFRDAGIITKDGKLKRIRKEKKQLLKLFRALRAPRRGAATRSITQTMCSKTEYEPFCWSDSYTTFMNIYSCGRKGLPSLPRDMLNTR